MNAGTFRPGLVLGQNQFRLERFLARGSTGEVYEASSSEHGRAAVKLLRQELARDDVWKRRFEREWNAALSIDSPYVARVLSAGVSGRTQSPWIAFELLEGESLDVLIAREPRPPLADVTRFIEHLLLGLEAAHAVQVVHRDIKPGNLFFERATSRLRILDFGVAKMTRLGEQTSGLTRLDDTLGTPDYMSPEHLRNPKLVDARTDLYGAGCVAFRLLSGRIPFEHGDPGMMRVLKESGGTPSLSAATRTTWPVELQRWIDRMLAFDRESRPQTARVALDEWRSAVAAVTAFRSAPLSDAGGFEADTDVSPPSSSE